jgi:glutamine synthetase type III
MENFGTFLRNCRQDLEEREPPKMPRKIKVALIDDGVDGLNQRFSSVIAAGETFSRRSEQVYNSYFKSTRGHGTIMAMLIRNMCPNVRLYVAKLHEEKTSRKTMSITAESAAKVRFLSFPKMAHDL